MGIEKERISGNDVPSHPTNSSLLYVRPPGVRRLYPVEPPKTVTIIAVATSSKSGPNARYQSMDGNSIANLGCC